MYADYRVPAAAKPSTSTTVEQRPQMWADIVAHWGVVVVELSERHHVDLFDTAVLTRPWPGVRTMILDLVSAPTSRLHNALRG